MPERTDEFNLLQDDLRLTEKELKSVSTRSNVQHSPTQQSKDISVLNDSFKVSLGSNESPSRKDGWQGYRKIQVLGEGSYGKVYKVQKRVAVM
jgi:serine/threonine protein kinase